MNPSLLVTPARSAQTVLAFHYLHSLGGCLPASCNQISSCIRSLVACLHLAFIHAFGLRSSSGHACSFGLFWHFITCIRSVVACLHLAIKSLLAFILAFGLRSSSGHACS